MSSVCPHCKDPNANLEYMRREAWFVVRFPDGDKWDETAEFRRIIKQPKHGRCSNCKRLVRL